MAEKGPKKFSRFMRHFPTTITTCHIFFATVLIITPSLYNQYYNSKNQHYFENAQQNDDQFM